MLLVIYRTLTDEGRAAVDRALSFEWTQSPKHIDAGNTRFGHAIRDLSAENVSGDALAYFANCWQQREA